jgi:hypothetical protein
MKRTLSFSLALVPALAAALLATGAHAQINSPPPPLMGQASYHLHSVPIIRSGGVEPFFECTNTSSAAIRVGVEAFAGPGGPAFNDPSATSVDIAPISPRWRRAVLQPGPFDGGTNPADRIATLSRFIPIANDPSGTAVAAQQPRGRGGRGRTVPRPRPGRLLDRQCAWLAPEGQGHGGTGRTTSYTIGRITAISATIEVGYGGERVARFRDQIVATNMSAPGDSGSLVSTVDNVAVGLLFAGSSVATIINQIENVRSLLRIEVAQQIL